MTLEIQILILHAVSTIQAKEEIFRNPLKGENIQMYDKELFLFQIYILMRLDSAIQNHSVLVYQCSRDIKFCFISIKTESKPVRISRSFFIF